MSMGTLTAIRWFIEFEVFFGPLHAFVRAKSISDHWNPNFIILPNYNLNLKLSTYFNSRQYSYAREIEKKIIWTLSKFEQGSLMQVTLRREVAERKKSILFGFNHCTLGWRCECYAILCIWKVSLKIMFSTSGILFSYKETDISNFCSNIRRIMVS